MRSESVIRALAALAQEHRLAAFRLLVQAGPDGVPAGAVADAVGVPASSMSFHLAQLTHAGLVTQRRQSRSIIYAADYAAMNSLMAYLMENCCGSGECAPSVGCTVPVSEVDGKDVA
ncbi:MAG: helix-turn-helix transcriptional regulator [Sphingomonadales bacterium]|nr:helix-turn-helix transcriptional regulator [Sphingomonadales bacterium]